MQQLSWLGRKKKYSNNIARKYWLLGCSYLLFSSVVRRHRVPYQSHCSIEIIAPLMAAPRLLSVARHAWRAFTASYKLLHAFRALTIIFLMGGGGG